MKYLFQYWITKRIQIGITKNFIKCINLINNKHFILFNVFYLDIFIEK